MQNQKNRGWRLGLRARFVAVIIIFFAVLVAVVAYISLRINTSALRSNLLVNVKSFASLATKPIGDTFTLYKDSGTVKIDQQINRFKDLNPAISQVMIVDLDGKPVYSFDKNNSPSNVNVPKNSSDTVVEYQSGQLNSLIYPYVSDAGAYRYAIVYSVSNDAINKSITDISRSILLFSIIGLIAAAVLIYILVNQLFIKPIYHVSQMAVAISAGRLEQTVKLDREDEIGDLADSVNKMADSLKKDIVRLQETDKLKSEFMMLISHNLRTPITIINGAVELIKRHSLDPETAKAVELVNSGGKRLGSLAEEILKISQIEAGQTELITREPTDLKSILTPIAAEFEPSVTAKGLKFSHNLQDNLIAQVNPTYFNDAIWNLLNNALKFTTKGGIHLDLHRDNNFAVIEVRDTGIGIATEEIPKLFTKFHRGTSTLDYDYEGSGLGLYLTKQIITLFGGTINVKSQLGRGTIFTIRLQLHGYV